MELELDEDEELEDELEDDEQESTGWEPVSVPELSNELPHSFVIVP